MGWQAHRQKETLLDSATIEKRFKSDDKRPADTILGGGSAAANRTSERLAPFVLYIATVFGFSTFFFYGVERNILAARPHYSK
jgi:hypothetical protein